MVLITWMLFTKIFYPHQINEFKKKLISNSNNKKEYSNLVLLNVLWFCIICVFLLLNVVPAILIANECSNGNILHLILGFLFSDIYIFHYALRKFVYRDNYCSV